MKEIITKASAGWLQINISRYKLIASYLTDAPQDIMNALTRYLKTKEPQIVYLNLEDAGDSYIVFDWHTFIINRNDEVKRFGYKYDTYEIAQQVYEDMTKHKEEIFQEFYLLDGHNLDKKRFNKSLKELGKAIRRFKQW